MEAAMVGMAAAGGARERLVRFVGEMAWRLPHVRQRENALVYVRGLIEHGGRKSLQPTLFRLGEDGARYESMQQFLADSPWDPELVVRACAERVAPEIGVLAWMIDDTGIPKDGRYSPGVKRQYSGTLGKKGNCQIVVSLHAAGLGGSAPLGWRLYLPEEWCADELRRRRAKIPSSVWFESKPEIARGLIEQAAGWELPRAPILADAAYGNDSGFRSDLDEQGLEYLVAVQSATVVYGPETVWAVPAQRVPGVAPSKQRPDRRYESVLELARRLPDEQWSTIAYRDRADGQSASSRFAVIRVVAAGPVRRYKPPRWEWLIVEWPEGEDGPSEYWLSNLPADSERERLARLARLRWQIELDYRQLKGELGLDHYEGRSYPGFHHHTALVTCAHAFLTLERLDPKAPQPA
jgi:SRSO17 transposase